MKPVLALSLAGLLAACSDKASVPQPSESANAALPPAPAPVASASQSAAAISIPAALQGRWALVPADCTSTRGDAKGLLIIGPAELRFYESVGKLRRAASSDRNSLRGTFDYTGEGMEWSREVSLSAAADGQSLQFADSGDDSPPSRRTYQRCQQKDI